MRWRDFDAEEVLAFWAHPIYNQFCFSIRPEGLEGVSPRSMFSTKGTISTALFDYLMNSDRRGQRRPLQRPSVGMVSFTTRTLRALSPGAPGPANRTSAASQRDGCPPHGYTVRRHKLVGRRELVRE